jgi:fumarate reductase subunit D
MNAPGSASRRLGARARQHAAYWAFVVHRISGLLLSLFLPLHFFFLGQALNGADAFDRALRLAEMPLVKGTEWVLVVLLALHLAGGVRLLLIEFARWSGLRKNWIAGGLGFAAAVGLAFALALVA